MTQALILDNLAVSRGSGPVISGVSLRVEPGKLLALVGPNGAGKTSLLESVSGVVTNSAGSITLDEVPLSKLSRIKRARLGLVHVEQGRTVFPSLTVQENLELTAKSPEELENALGLFPELAKRRHSASGLLSGGEQQMVVLARAFAAKPKYLLIDEMSLGLAPVVFLRLLPIIRNIAEAGVGVLMVEQFAQLSLEIADGALVVSGGRVTYQGAAKALLDDPKLLHGAYLGVSS
ncbi:branched-chain amino acid transport system ATP-binding protein [Psychromicrobium silvestre]|uniref:Branched-chain amino acid transport system ATP-binding protein n=1 Tax=Psychromicrobium silvestre TaxID=1645614 RepID=A0A7Y9LSF1_9MICC|nr:ABC transporter ATP-binding protein [Psychromicrobium silvestre]NYE94733.1 branched-chain amino acid transport system ATP-binding protein [Psychromicrobium silvestre]